MSETAELMVTQEMISAGRGAFGYANPALDYAAIYRAMAAAKPEWSKRQGESAQHHTVQVQIAELEADNTSLRAYCETVERRNADGHREIAMLRAERDAWKYLHDQLADKQMATADKVGNHDYHGPRKPILDGDGKPTGKTEAVPDESHERFHGAVGEVLSGNIIRPARDQMERALADARARDDKAPQPIRPVTTSGDARRIGWTG